MSLYQLSYPPNGGAGFEPATNKSWKYPSTTAPARRHRKSERRLELTSTLRWKAGFEPASRMANQKYLRPTASSESE